MADPSVILRCVVSLKDVRVLGYFRDGPVQAIVIEQSLSGVVCPACGGPAQIIDIVPSRTYVDVATYLHAQPQAWKDHIRYATLDMSPTYRAVYTVVLPKATQIADHFHVIMLANRALDEVRRRVQQETLSHRGRKHDPLYRIRKTLTQAQETLNQDTSERLAHLLALGDPNGEVAIAYRIKEQLRVFYRLNNSDQAYRELDTLIDTCQARPMPPEIKRLGRTLNQWRSQIMAYHKAHLTNSITETMNNLIKRTKRIGYGFTNFTNYRIRVLLYAGKPNWRILNTIYPSTPPKSEEPLYGHCGRANDSMFKVRKMLLADLDLLTTKQRNRLETLFTHDEYVEVEATWASTRIRSWPIVSPTEPRAYASCKRSSAISPVARLAQSARRATLGRTLKKRAY